MITLNINKIMTVSKYTLSDSAQYVLHAVVILYKYPDLTVANNFLDYE